MPKTRKRTKGTAQRNTIGTVKSTNARNVVQPSTETASVRRPPTTSLSKTQGLIWPALVSLGCWGMAISFFFFSTDPNHMVFGLLVVVMALLWTFSFGVRVRKMMALRQQ